MSARINRLVVPAFPAFCVMLLMSAGCASQSTIKREPRASQPISNDLSIADAPAGAVWLDSLDVAAVRQDWGKPRAGRSVDDHPLTLGGKVYPHGLGTHAFSETRVELHGAAREFRSVIGVDDESASAGSVVFVVVLDGHEVFRSGVRKGREGGEEIRVDLRHAKEMWLLVENAGDNIDYDHADWAGAMLMLKPLALTRPKIVPPPVEPAPTIATGAGIELRIHSPRVVGATPGRPFLFRIPATGPKEMLFRTEGLPDGLTLDEQTGIISGRLTKDGSTDVRVAIETAGTRIDSTLRIVAGTHTLAQTPIMGWNSWNAWGTAVDDAKVRAAADALVATGLAAHGFQYVNIDDAWEGTRDEQGRIRTNEKFPDMKALSDYVHSKGLKLGIYSSPGRKTCGGYEGSYEHEQQDAATWAEWGIDLVKYDWCSYEDVVKAQHPGEEKYEKTAPELRKPYEVMRAALDAVDRDIVYSLCQYGMGDVWKWGAEVGGNYWRTTGDITDTWGSLSDIGFGQVQQAPFAGPGHWNDPDMLVVGKVGWGPNLHPTKLSPNEQLTHISMWALLAAPLLIGCDLSQIDPFTLALLTNDEVIEIDQDPLGRQAKRVSVDGFAEVWARPLADGSMAVGLFNRSPSAAYDTADWKALGIAGRFVVRNVWQQRDEGTFADKFTANVPRHGVVLIRIKTPAASKAIPS